MPDRENARRVGFMGLFMYVFLLVGSEWCQAAARVTSVAFQRAKWADGPSSLRALFGTMPVLA